MIAPLNVCIGVGIAGEGGANLPSWSICPSDPGQNGRRSIYRMHHPRLCLDLSCQGSRADAARQSGPPFLSATWRKRSFTIALFYSAVMSPFAHDSALAQDSHPTYPGAGARCSRGCDDA